MVRSLRLQNFNIFIDLFRFLWDHILRFQCMWNPIEIETRLRNVSACVWRECALLWRASSYHLQIAHAFVFWPDACPAFSTTESQSWWGSFESCDNQRIMPCVSIIPHGSTEVAQRHSGSPVARLLVVITVRKELNVSAPNVFIPWTKSKVLLPKQEKSPYSLSRSSRGINLARKFSFPDG